MKRSHKALLAAVVITVLAIVCANTPKNTHKEETQ